MFMKNLIRIGLLPISILAIFCSLHPASAGEAPTYVALTKAGEQPERKKILDAARAKAQEVFNRKVRLVVRFMGMENNWAIALLVPLTEDGQGFDWPAAMQPSGAEGASQAGWIEVLLRRENGKWSVRDFTPEAEQLGLNAWPKKYPGIPQKLLAHAGVATNCDPCGQ